MEFQENDERVMQMNKPHARQHGLFEIENRAETRENFRSQLNLRGRGRQRMYDSGSLFLKKGSMQEK